MWPKIEEKDLPPNLKKVEKQIEDEIIDVLNESWDDSTVLRRDNLLAEIVLRLERMIVRFVDEDAVGTGSRVVAMDMRQVASRLQLSPREHRTEISLSVGDMSVQRLKIADSAANGGNVSGGHVSDEEDGVTGIFGFGETPNVGPQLLFAIGRAKEEGGDESIDRHEGFVIMSEAAQKARKPLFQMVYRRMAPRLNVLHELDAKFSSISVIYDEDAIDGLSNLFDTEAALLEKKNDLTDTDLCDLGAVGDTHAYVNLAIPSVLFELRSRRTSLIDNARSSVSTPFASAKIADVDIGISKTEPLLTRLKLCMGSLVVEDMFEKTPIMPLIRTTEIKPRGLITSSLSNSCPDLHSVPHEAGVTLSSSLPSQLAFKPVFRDPAPTLPPTGATRARRRKRMPSTMIDNDFGVHRHGERPLFSFIFVDSKHPDYESKYAKSPASFVPSKWVVFNFSGHKLANLNCF
uniref:Rad21_Rec8 domain-containing protein n=1 Tax=Panagrellus redivivus TaxID=6233 RepID=A0A7E4V7C3_PANRE